MKLGFLISGDLGLNVLKKMPQNYFIQFVMTDKQSLQIITYCKINNIPVFAGNPRKDNAIQFYSVFVIDVLLSVNYMFLIEKGLINFPKLAAFNVHGSLLPKYRGRTPHVWAIINNEKQTGVTAHLIDQDCDTGDILEQININIFDEDTGANILEKFNDIYFAIIKTVIEKIINNQIMPKPQDHSKATFFGKRVPEDGLIDWNWQKERIKNWVRAQAYPYPGAFTYYDGVKLTIDSVSFVDDGFNNNIPNGSVLSISPLKVKTPNGIILINSHRGILDNLINTKTIFG